MATFHCEMRSKCVVLLPRFDEEHEELLSLCHDLPRADLLLTFTNCLNMHLTVCRPPADIVAMSPSTSIFKLDAPHTRNRGDFSPNVFSAILIAESPSA